MALTPAPTPPTTADPSTFNARADAYVAWQADTHVPELDTFKASVDATGAQVALDRLATAADVLSTAANVGLAEDQVDLATAQRVLADAAAAAAIGAPGLIATSTTSTAIPTSFPTSRSLTFVETSRLLAVGQTVRIARTSDATKRMTGVITAVDNTAKTMTVSVETAWGTGTFTDWTISLSADGLSAIASQAEAEAGVATDKEMTPLRVKQAIDAQRPGWVLIATLSTASGGSVSATGISTLYTDLMYTFEDVLGDSTGTIALATGDATPTYAATPISVAGVTASTYARGGGILHNVRHSRVVGASFAHAAGVALTPPDALGQGPNTSTGTQVFQVTGGVRALRFTGLGINFAGGSIKIWGR